MWTKGLSTMRKDSANNKSTYSEKEPPSLDSRSRRFTLERVFGEGMSRTFFFLRRKRGYGSRHPVPFQIGVTLESRGLLCGFGFCAPSQQLHVLGATTPIGF